MTRLAEYDAFLTEKRIVDAPTGLPAVPDLRPHLFDWQADIVRWALTRGRAAIFADCGLGKTPMGLEWASHVPGPVLTLTPLSVAPQTVLEGQKFGIPVTHVRDMPRNPEGIYATNYELLDRFDLSQFSGLWCDESGILKNFEGATRNAIIEASRAVPFRLATTATPAPNDYMELGSHAEYLGVMSRAEMLAMFFVHDGGETQAWRLKAHATTDFWRWVSSWAVLFRKPSDLGYSDDGFTLPALTVVPHVVASASREPTEGRLFAAEAQTLQERLAARRETVAERAADCAATVNATPGTWVVWCHLNAEADALATLIPDAVEVRGTDSPEEKEATLAAFAAGKIRVLITKPSIAGYGMNWQFCYQTAFVGLSDSWEQYYQALRRFWRFGQLHEVVAHLFSSDREGPVAANIRRKDDQAAAMAARMVDHTRAFTTAAIRGMTRDVATYERDVAAGKDWTAHLGDCVEVTRELADDSIDYSIFSPPFKSLYTYSNSPRDMGNCVDGEIFMAHFGYAVAELYRATKPGRLVSFHCMNLPTSKVRDGVIGLTDFRGQLIRLFEDYGWIFHSEVCIWKDPVTQMQRTKALGLLHKTIRSDSSMSRQGIPDYLVTMRKPGKNAEPIAHTAEEYPVALWQRVASPVWMDINPSDTLQYRSAREHDDERHICPLQLPVIRRAIQLWSLPGEIVCSLFGGIGSEGVVALEEGRQFVCAELKRSYWTQLVANLKRAGESRGRSIFDLDESEGAA
jgi:hypothetical protein